MIAEYAMNTTGMTADEIAKLAGASSNAYLCQTCREVVEVGAWPFCPHGSGSSRVNGDECDYIDHNLGPEPIRITSWSQRRALMAARGLVDFQHDVVVPDGMAPNPQRPSRWSAYRQCDPDHLAWLASRLCTGKAAKETPDPNSQIQSFTPIVEDLS